LTIAEAAAPATAAADQLDWLLVTILFDSFFIVIIIMLICEMIRNGTHCAVSSPLAKLEISNQPFTRSKGGHLSLLNEV
jgi:hypothetical protein